MEFLRFGSRIPGTYWGCCAVDIIQNFKFDPDEKASIQLVTGDSGQPIFRDKQHVFLGKTYREIFWSRLKVSTFSDFEHPNHAFLAVMTEDQINREIGGKWLKLLHEAGFEFIRAFQNSVYTGSLLDGELAVDPFAEEECEPEHNPNYLFGLFRNIGNGKMDNVFEPPYAWTELGEGSPSHRPVDPVGLTKSIDEYQLAVWNEMPPVNLYKRFQLEDDGVPVHYAGTWGNLQGPRVQEPTKAAAPAPFASQEVGMTNA